MDLAALRKEYTRAALDETGVDRDPLAQLSHWLDAALKAGVPEPSAMTLATVGPDGRPSSRIVLLKGVDARGLVFYTNRASRKGRELAQNPQAALLFFWPELERQLRVEGRVSQVSDAEGDAYFASRPRASQLGAWASPQSVPIESRAWLERALADAERAHPGGTPVPRPQHWGGYRLEPAVLEFWQGRQSRLHDRVAYQRDGDRWQIRRLAP